MKPFQKQLLLGKACWLDRTIFMYICCSGGYTTGSSVIIWKILIANGIMDGIRCEMHVYKYDTDNGYRKQMVRENVPCFSFSCQFSLSTYIVLTLYTTYMYPII